MCTITFCRRLGCHGSTNKPQAFCSRDICRSCILLIAVAVIALGGPGAALAQPQTVRLLRVELLLAGVASVAVVLTTRRLLFDNCATYLGGDGAACCRGWRWPLTLAAALAVFGADRRELLARYRRPLAIMAKGIVASSVLMGVQAAIPAGNGLNLTVFCKWRAGPEHQRSLASTHDHRSLASANAGRRHRRYSQLAGTDSSPSARPRCIASRPHRTMARGCGSTGARRRQQRRAFQSQSVGECAPERRVTRGRPQIAQLGGDSWFEWSWAKESDRDRAVPEWMLSRRRTRYSTALAVYALRGAIRLCMAGAVGGALWWLVVMLRTRWHAWGEHAAGVRRAAAPSGTSRSPSSASDWRWDHRTASGRSCIGGRDSASFVPRSAS